MLFLVNHLFLHIIEPVFNLFYYIFFLLLSTYVNLNNPWYGIYFVTIHQSLRYLLQEEYIRQVHLFQFILSALIFNGHIGWCILFLLIVYLIRDPCILHHLTASILTTLLYINTVDSSSILSLPEGMAFSIFVSAFASGVLLVAEGMILQSEKSIYD